MSETTDPTAGEPPAENDARPTCRCAPDCRERITCPKVGQVGHWQCGWCKTHDAARHRCGCLATRVIPPAVPATPDAAGERGCPHSAWTRIGSERYCASCGVDRDDLASPAEPDTEDASECACPPCPGRGNDGHGLTHCAECCFGTGVEAQSGCPVHYPLPAASTDASEGLSEAVLSASPGTPVLTAQKIAAAILASDWLAAREAAARAEGAAEALRGAGDDLLQVGLLAPNRIETSQWLHDRAARIARESR